MHFIARAASILVLAWATASPVPAQGLGTHDQFDSSGVTLTGWLPPWRFAGNGGADDCWGYTSPSGREYAIIGLTAAIGFAEVTSPTEPVVVATMPAPSSNWHDVKTYGDHAYAVSEGGSGIQVFDLSQIDSGIVTHVTDVTTGGATSTHNVAIDTTSGFLYRCDGGVSGLRIYDLADPDLPAYVGSWTQRTAHDAQIVTLTGGPFAGRQIGYLCSETTGYKGVTIVDLTNKQDVAILGEVTYPNAAVAHQGWLSADGSLFYYGDESDELSFGFTTRTHVFDVSSLEAPTHLGFFTNGNTASDHNLYVDGSTIYEANFMSGLRVYDATSPLAPTEVAWFDTQLATDAAKTEGLWSNYPFFASGTIVGSDEVKGLFVWRLGEPTLTFSYPSGVPDPIPPAGATVIVHVDELAPGDLLGGSATFHYSVDGAAEVSVPLTDLGGGDFEGVLPPATCGQVVAWRVSARSTDGGLWRSPASTEDDHHFALVAWSATPLASFAMEADDGWVGGQPGDTAFSGIWERGKPNGTAVQSEIDHSPAGTECWFTGQATAGLDSGTDDVDGGSTTLLSPALDLSAASDPWISYWRWFHNAGGNNPFGDVLEVEISSGGGPWTNVETVGPTGPEVVGGWRLSTFRVADLVAPGPEVRLRFRATDDPGNPSIVEAMLDDLLVLELDCADCNGNGVGDATDLALGTSPDLDGNGSPDECDPLSVDTVQLSLSAGGTQTFTLDAGADFGGEVYWLVGSVTGTSPGLTSAGVTLPLNYDVYMQFTLELANLWIANSLGVLDGAGTSTAALTLAAGFDPTLAGLQLDHAYVVLGLGPITPLFASNPVPLAFVP